MNIWAFFTLVASICWFGIGIVGLLTKDFKMAILGLAGFGGWFRCFGYDMGWLPKD